MVDGQQENQTENTDGDRDYKALSFLQRVEGHILRRMFSGLFVLIPALVTIWILYFILSQVDKFVRTMVRGSQLDVLDKAGLGVAIALIVLYVVGMLVANRLGRRAIGWQSAVLTRIPIVRSIYGWRSRPPIRSPRLQATGSTGLCLSSGRGRACWLWGSSPATFTLR